MQAVNEHGKVWTKIVKTHFPGRTGLAAKNRCARFGRIFCRFSRNPIDITASLASPMRTTATPALERSLPTYTHTSPTENHPAGLHLPRAAPPLPRLPRCLFQTSRMVPSRWRSIQSQSRTYSTAYQGGATRLPRHLTRATPPPSIRLRTASKNR